MSAAATAPLFKNNPRLRFLLEELFAIDLRTLALFRVSLGVLLLVDVLWRLRDLEAFYTDFGVIPRDRLPLVWLDASYWSLHTWGGGAGWQGLLFFAAAASAVLLALGWKTRLVTVASWVLLTSLHNRNPMVLQGGDMMLRMLLFWAMFLPLGARFSLDARRLALPPVTPADPENNVPEAPPRAFSAATVGALLQVAYVYWFTVALKHDSSWRMDGTALWLALNIDQFATGLGVWMREHLHPFVLRVLTHFTVLLEEFGPSLAFFPLNNGPLRTGVVFTFWFFHLFALNLTLRLGPFPWVCAVAWALFLPPWFWDVLLPRLWARWPRPSAARRGVEQGWGRLSALFAPPAGTNPARLRPVRLGLSRPAGAVAALLLVYISLWNLRALNGVAAFRYVFPSSVDVVAHKLRVDQNWAMFAPRPMVDDGWFVFPATLRDGSRVDLYREYVHADGGAGSAPVIAPGKGDVDWSKPASVSGSFRSERWRKYLMNLWSKKHHLKRIWLAEYLRRRWDREHAGDPARQISRIELCYMREETPLEPGGAFPPLKRVSLYRKTWTTLLSGVASDPAPAAVEPGGGGGGGE